MNPSLKVVCGQLLVGGFDGTRPSASFGRALAAGERAGAILFRRNLEGGLAETARLNGALRDLAPADHPPLLGVDQEGGRVQRLGPPTLRVPSMTLLAGIGEKELLVRLARHQGEELAALGFTMNFAPVLDVNTRAENPIIGDRSFGEEPESVSELGVAWGRALAEGGVDPCGKHFPGHGDTRHDSHLTLPVVEHERVRLEAVELAPFRAAVAASFAALMTAHVLYPALDPKHPATLSHAVCTDLLRGELGFSGVLVSDDLEMGALKDGKPLEDVAVVAVAAGCDLLLVCTDEGLQDRAHEALVREAEKSPSFRRRCEEAARRSLTLRRKRPPAPVADDSELERRVGGSATRDLEAELERRLERSRA